MTTVYKFDAGPQSGQIRTTCQIICLGMCTQQEESILVYTAWCFYTALGGHSEWLFHSLRSVSTNVSGLTELRRKASHKRFSLNSYMKQSHITPFGVMESFTPTIMTPTVPIVEAYSTIARLVSACSGFSVIRLSGCVSIPSSLSTVTLVHPSNVNFDLSLSCQRKRCRSLW